MTASPEKRASFRRVWLAPLTLAVLSGAGLITALVGDDIWDVLSWIGLGIPTALCGYYWWKPRPKSGS